MTGRWKGNSATNRAEELPPDWPAIRQAVLERDGFQCVWKMPSGVRCPNDATDVDHIGSRHNHSMRNLRSLCSPHHAKRTAIQGAAEAAKLRTPPPLKPERNRHPSTGWR